MLGLDKEDVLAVVGLMLLCLVVAGIIGGIAWSVMRFICTGGLC